MYRRLDGLVQHLLVELAQLILQQLHLVFLPAHPQRDAERLHHHPRALAGRLLLRLRSAQRRVHDGGGRLCLN